MRYDFVLLFLYIPTVETRFINFQYVKITVLQAKYACYCSCRCYYVPKNIECSND